LIEFFKNKQMVFIYVAAFITGACSILYELLIAQTISWFMSNSVTWYSLVVGVYIGAMGIGAMIYHLRGNRRNAIDLLYQTEIFLGILGGLSVLLIHAGFILVQYFITTQYTESFSFFFFRTGFLLFCFLIIIGIGMLTGMEIPLFIRMATQKPADKNIYNRVIGVDCLGACVGGMLFPLLLLPFASLLSISFLVAMTNLLCLLFILFAFRKKVVNFGIRLSICVVMIIGYFYLNSQDHQIEQYFLKKIYYTKHSESIFKFFSPDDNFPEVERIHSLYQMIDIVEKYPAEIEPIAQIWCDAYSNKISQGKFYSKRFFLALNKKIQFDSDEEEFYHEYFAHVPIILQKRVPRKILVLGGGDGLLIRELLKHSEVEHITHVDIDKKIVQLSKTRDDLLYLNRGALDDRRVETIIRDGYKYMRNCKETFDAIYLDFPLACDYNLNKLYSFEFYYFVKKHLRDNGFAVLDIESFTPLGADSGKESVQGRREVYFNTLHAAGFKTILPYGIKLEADNQKAKAGLNAYYENFMKKQGYKDFLGDGFIKRRDAWVDEVLQFFPEFQRDGYLMVKKEDQKFDFEYINFKIPLCVLNQKRFKAAFSYFHLFDVKIDQEKINSIMKPTLLNM